MVTQPLPFSLFSTVPLPPPARFTLPRLVGVGRARFSSRSISVWPKRCPSAWLIGQDYLTSTKRRGTEVDRRPPSGSPIKFGPSLRHPPTIAQTYQDHDVDLKGKGLRVLPRRYYSGDASKDQTGTFRFKHTTRFLELHVQHAATPPRRHSVVRSVDTR